EETSSQIGEILAAARSRSTVFQEWGFGAKLNKGRGLSALFDGEPGTGKTLCAEILAAELGLTLYRINVANVVSKYIGETEKNLTRIFKEADDSHCMILFDEADSLFSQRTDVKSVHDKYSNMEINVLLQLMERYDGLVVLTTNLKKSIDKAFERRLGFKVSFPFPDAEYREEIWRHIIPSTAPVADDLDFWVLGRSFELSGGSIKNAILRAAYRAAAAQRAISQNDLVEAAKYECAAAGKLYRLYQPDEF
ncbi:MAG: SpoVK/Ycf46/Vps4 family AAA+-type ATPase, partial [Myxococcota bacterium]